MQKQSAAMINWHRKTMLPKYAAFLHNQANIANDGGWSRQKIETTVKVIRSLLDETVEGASHFIAAVLIEQMTEEKISYLNARMAENLIKRREKNTPQNFENKVERQAKRIARFTGPLNNNQISIIRAYKKRDSYAARLWLDNREKRQLALTAFLRGKPAKDELANFIYRLLMHAHEIVDPSYQAISEARWKRIEAMYFEVLKSIDDVQHKRLITTLRNYASELADLSGV